MNKRIFLIFSLIILSIFFTSGCFLFDLFDIDRRTKQERAIDAGDPSLCMKATHPDICRAAVARSLGTSVSKDDFQDDTSAGCKTDEDCDAIEYCDEGSCKTRECTPKAKFCPSKYVLAECIDGKLVRQNCAFECKDSKCMSSAEKEKQDEKNSCEAGYQKCITDHRREYCYDGKKTESYCYYDCKGGACIDKKIKEDDSLDISTINSNIAESQDFIDYFQGPYMDALDKQIEILDSKDSRKKGLESYKGYLEGMGEKYEDATTTLQALEDAKKIFLDSYDPSMDIENMDVQDILDKSLTERMGDLWTDMTHWGTKSPEQIEQSAAEDQFKIYKAMLERQEEIDFLKKSTTERLGNVMAENLKGYAADKIIEVSKEAAEAAGGAAFAVVGTVSDALDAVKEEAQNMMYTGLIKAYNRRRIIMENTYSQMSNEEIHKKTVESVIDMPYLDAKTGVIIAKYGNLIENADCTIEGNKNSLCIDQNTFWVAMDKSYNHFNEHKLFLREIGND
ncbi:MAG: hypothetical protein KAR87_03680 [Candidatus Aenigmarchaeota archaeon]|nr:hypothetical protein [Candidatus Aenigmarchaeota archaeon]